MMRHTFIIAIIAAVLSGCTMIPEYKRPDAPVPAAWPTTGPAYKETGSDFKDKAAADVNWREFYTDEKLIKIIEMALRNNRNLRVAALNIEKMRAVYGISRLVVLPLPDANGSLNNYRNPADVADGNDARNIRLYNANFGVTSWEIDFFGRIRSLSERALQQYFATEHARNSVQIALVAEVANAYMLLAAEHDALELARSTLKAQEESRELIKRRYELGASSEIDLDQVTTRVEAARVDEARFTNLVANDENALAFLVGAPIPPELLATNLTSIKLPKDIYPGLTSDILLKRPDILEAESQLKAANANIGAARAAFFPRVTLTTNVGTTSDELSALFKAGSQTWGFVPQVTVPIFSSVINWANLKAAKADREIYVAQYEKAIQAGFKEVADALARRGTIMDQMKAQKVLTDASQKIYDLSTARYRNGIDSYLNVLDAQRSLYSAQQGLIVIQLARLVNLVNMYKVLGGGGTLEPEIKP
jgi:outer membrane protein, multidrug efflux system